jgi:hypothetical protein
MNFVLSSNESKIDVLEFHQGYSKIRLQGTARSRECLHYSTLRTVIFSKTTNYWLNFTPEFKNWNFIVQCYGNFSMDETYCSSTCKAI